MTSIIAVNDSSSREIFPELTCDVIDRMKDAENPRLREILSLVVSHVHAIVREAEITHDEWWQAIDFLTRAGKMCSDSRQEFILLSDILRISMLVDAIDHVGGPGLSESTVLGPFYAGQQRELAAGESILLREEDAPPLFIEGSVASGNGEPIQNALETVWQTAPNQLYDVQDDGQPAGPPPCQFPNRRARQIQLQVDFTRQLSHSQRRSRGTTARLDGGKASVPACTCSFHDQRWWPSERW